MRSGQNENVGLNGYGSENYTSSQRYESKIPLKLVMDPRGVVQDVHSQGITFDQNNGMLSPDKCAELISALHTDAPKGKGSYNNSFSISFNLCHFSDYIQIIESRACFINR